MRPPFKPCADCGGLQRRWADYFICDSCMRKRDKTPLNLRGLRRDLAEQKEKREQDASTH